MACDFILPSGEKSQLYKEVRDQYGEAVADHVYKHIHSDAFMAFFGNWKLFHSYDQIQEKELIRNHRTEKDAKSHAMSLNESYGAGAARALPSQGSHPWRVDLVKPFRKDVSQAVNKQGEPLLFYHLDGLLSFTHDKSKGGTFEKPGDYEGDMSVPAKGELLPVFLNIRNLEGRDNLGRVTDGAVSSQRTTVISEEQVQPFPQKASTRTVQGTLDLATEDELVARRAAAHKAIMVLKDKLEIYEKKGINKDKTTATIQKEINKLQVLVQKNKDIEAIMAFLSFADDQSKRIKEDKLPEILKEFRTPGITREDKRKVLRKLATAADYLSAFDVIEDIYSDLEHQRFSISGVEEEIIDDEFKAKHINNIRGRISDLKSSYLKVAKEITVDWLMEYNTNSDLTKEDITQMLTHVHQDIGKGVVYLNALAESRDQVLEMVDRVLSSERDRINRDMSTFENTEFKKTVEALEAYQRGVGGQSSVVNYEKLYDFMLIKNKLGTLTGKYIEPNSIKGKALPKAQRDFLVMFDKQYKAAQKRLPSAFRKENALIAILKSGGERALQDAKGIKSGATALGRYAKEQVIINPDETEFIEVFVDEQKKEHKFIPIKYTATIGDTQSGIDPSDLSLDMAGNLLRFMTMAKNYSAMNKIVVELEAVKDLVGERTYTAKKGDKFLKRKGKTDPVALSGESSNAFNMLEQYFDMHLYGEYKEKEGTLAGTNIDKAKAADTLRGYTSLTALALNLYSGVNNATFGHVMNMIESAGGQFYSGKDYRDAKKIYWSNFGGFIKDSTARFNTNKINLWMQANDLYQEFDEFGKPLASNMKTGRMLSKASFFIQETGEHMIQTQLAIAMAKGHRVIGGKILSYQDWIVAHNKSNTKASKKEFQEQGVDLLSTIDVQEGAVGSNVKISDKEMFRFASRVKGVYQRLHGNYSKQDKVILKKKAWGRLVLMLRDWLKPGWDRRFASETFDNREAFNQRLGANIAGNYATAANFLIQIYKDNKGMAIGLALVNKEKSGWNNLSEWQKSNIKRTFGETAFILASLMLISALGEPDDDDPWIKSMAIYQSHRLYSELRFYSSAPEALKILKSPTATISTVEKFGKAVHFLTEPVFNLSFEWERYTRGPRKGDLKFAKELWGLVPYGNQVSRAMEPEENAKYISKLF